MVPGTQQKQGICQAHLNMLEGISGSRTLILSVVSCWLAYSPLNGHMYGPSGYLRRGHL